MNKLTSRSSPRSRSLSATRAGANPAPTVKVRMTEGGEPWRYKRPARRGVIAIQKISKVKERAGHKLV